MSKLAIFVFLQPKISSEVVEVSVDVEIVKSFWGAAAFSFLCNFFMLRISSPLGDRKEICILMRQLLLMTACQGSFEKDVLSKTGNNG